MVKYFLKTWPDTFGSYQDALRQNSGWIFDHFYEQNWSVSCLAFKHSLQILSRIEVRAFGGPLQKLNEMLFIFVTTLSGSGRRPKLSPPVKQMYRNSSNIIILSFLPKNVFCLSTKVRFWGRKQKVKQFSITSKLCCC